MKKAKSLPKLKAELQILFNSYIRDMTTTEFATYVNAIRDWASEDLSIYIPEPGENIKIQFNETEES